ncbi:MAG: hypothetical protein ACR2PK_03320 [Acidimicrobiales bacterium]
MVDFDTSARLFGQSDITVVAASVDSVESTAKLTEGLRLGFVQMLAELDPSEVAESTGAFVQTGERNFLQATGFVLDRSGAILNSVYSSGPIGRFVASDVLKRVAFEVARESGG